MKQGKKDKRKGRNLFWVLVIVLVIILVFSLLVNIYFELKKPVYSEEFLVTGGVSDFFGLTGGSSELDFGVTMPNVAVDKKVILNNDFDFPLRVEVIVSPGLEDIIFGSSNFVIEPNKEYEYFVSFFPSENASLGNYTGTIRFDFYKIK